MRRRAESVGDTRLRITEATMGLHTTIGPSRTTVAGIAEAAGVTRLTVYRHFADLDELFVACMGHWATLHPAPDPHAWQATGGLEQRARQALREVYAWYGEVGDDLTVFQRDRAWMPESAQERARERERDRVAALVDGLASDLDPEAASRLRAAAALVLALPTWRTLVVDHGLSVDEAVELGVRMLVAAGPTGR
jgi:AcrR family transcriptional regulator